jgi:DNA-binding Lrp family transcriptional regulator
VLATKVTKSAEDVQEAPEEAGRLRRMRSSDGSELDRLDARIILTLRAHPRVGLLEVSRRLGVARGTVQARLEKLRARGVITGFGPELDPARMGYPVLAFVFLEIAQGRLEEAVDGLREVPEVLEAHGVTGDQDLLCRVVARDNGHLQEVINRMVHHPAVRRSTSSIAMSRQIPPRVEALVAAAARGAEPGTAEASTGRGRA